MARRPKPSRNVYRVGTGVNFAGTADVTAALTSFIATVPDGGTVVFQPNGIYRIDSTLLLTNRTITLDGSDNITFVQPSTAADNRPCVKFVGGSSTIRRIWIDGGYATPNVFNAAVQHNHGVMMLGTTGGGVDQCTINNVGGDAVYLGINGTTICQYPTVQRTTVNGTGRCGVGMVALNRGLIKGNDLTNTGYTMFDIEPNTANDFCTNITIDGNIMRASSHAENFSVVSPVTTNATINNITFSNNQIIGRKFWMAVAPQVSTNRWSDFVVTGNTCNVSNAGTNKSINLDWCDNITVTGNTIPSDLDYPGCHFHACTNFTVTGNNFGSAYTPYTVSGGGTPAATMINMIELFHDGGTEGAALRTAGIVDGMSFKAVLTTSERTLVESNDLPLFYWVVTDAAIASASYPQTTDASAAANMATLETNTGTQPHVYMFSGPEWDNEGAWRTAHVPNRPAPVTNGLTTYTAFMNYYRSTLAFNSPPMDLDNPARGYKNVAVTSYAQNVNYAFDLGFDAVLLERINDDISGMTPGMAMMRGAAHQAGDKVWGIDYSTWRSWTSSPTEFNGAGQQTGGWTMAWFKRHYYHAWAGGANISHFEAMDIRTGADGSGFNPLGREVRDGHAFMIANDRGTPVVPFAIVHDHYAGHEPKFGEWIQADYCWYSDLPYTAADTRLAALFQLLFPNYNKHGTLTPGGPANETQMRSVFTGSFGGDMRAYEPQGSTAWGESFDVFSELVPLATLQRYSRVIYTATTIPTVVQSYVTAGGTALRSDSVTSTTMNTWAAAACPVRVTGATCVWLVGDTAAGYTVTILNIGGSTINPTITAPSGTTTPSVAAYGVGVFFV